MVSFNLDHHRNPEVLIQDFNSSAVRILTLNRPRHFNALSGKMLSQLLRLFLAHDHDVKVKVVILKETALGAVPETGASYFLSRLPGFLGEYLALTGARLDGPEMLACGLATHFVPATKLALLEQELIASIGALTNERTSSCDLVFYVSSIIHKYSIQPALKERDSAWHNMDVIEKCFSKRTVEEVVSALEKEATYTDGHVNGANPWLTSTIQSLKKASPISLKISLRSIREGRSQGLGECLVREYRMVYHIATGEISTDFREGCTALLVDKDKIQKWEPCKLELVSDQMVDRYFSKLDEVE